METLQSLNTSEKMLFRLNYAMKESSFVARKQVIDGKKT